MKAAMKRLLSIVVAVSLILLFPLPYIQADSRAEDWSEEEIIQIWIVCQPDSFVNIRAFPNGRSESVGRLDSGDSVYTDGNTKRGFLHVYASIEPGEGWVHKGYVVYDEPVKPEQQEYTVQSKGRVACRRSAGGTRRCWVRNGDPVRVYYISDEWSITNKGFIKTEFLAEAGAGP